MKKTLQEKSCESLLQEDNGGNVREQEEFVGQNNMLDGEFGKEDDGGDGALVSSLHCFHFRSWFTR